MVTEMLEVMREIKRNCQEELVNSDIVSELSVGDFFRARFQEYLNHREMQSETERELREAFYHWYMRSVFPLFIFPVEVYLPLNRVAGFSPNVYEVKERKLQGYVRWISDGYEGRCWNALSR